MACGLRGEGYPARERGSSVVSGRVGGRVGAGGEFAPERIHVRAQLREGSGVVDDVIGARPFLLAGHLRGDHRVRFGGREAAVLDDAGAACGDGRVHEDDAVHGVFELGLEEERDVEHHDAGAGGLGGGEGVLAPGGDLGMDDRVERGALRGLVEDDTSEGGAVEGAVGGEDGGSPARDDAREGRRALGDRLAGEDVGVDDDGTVGRESRGHGGLPGGDVPRETDDEHRVIVPRARRFRTVTTPRTRRRAFTLIEILMVMALIGILAGWAVSRVSTTRYRMDANIRLLQNLLIGAQQTAIARNIHVQLMFDASSDDQHRVRILLDADNDGQVSVSETVTYRALDGARFLSPTTTIDGDTPAYATGSGLVGSRPPLLQAISIGPNGALAGDVVIYIGTVAGRGNDLRALAITGATARTAFWSHAGGSWTRRDY